MHTNTQFNCVLPSILASMLDADKDSVLVDTNRFYTGLAEEFVARGFRVTSNDDSQGSHYNTVVAVLPFGQRDMPELVTLNYYMESPAEKIILVVVPNFLFSNRPRLWDVKRRLLEQNIIEASIMLPPRLMPDTSLAVSLLVIDKTRTQQQGDRQVKFIDASDLSPRRIEKLHSEGKIDAIRTLVREKISYSGPSCASKHSLDLVVAGESLLASAHCLTEEQKKARRIVMEAPNKELGQVAHFFRPLLPNREERGEKIHILNVQQLSQFGYTNPVAEQDGYFERSGKMDPLLRSGDIVLGFRGVLGKVGIIAPDFSSDDLWVPSQSCLVLRPAKKDYDPRLLFLYLRSEVGQTMIKKLASGATVPMVQINDLKRLPVILPTPEQAEKMLADFEKEVSVCSKIEALEAERRNLANGYWNL